MPIRVRLTSAHVIGAIGAWLMVTGIGVNIAALLSRKPIFQAVIAMGDGLIVLWAGLCGFLMVRHKDRICAWVRAIPVDWRVKFVVMATALICFEEVITTTMTNLAPLLGVPYGAAYITASRNYFDVIFFHSVVVIAPSFIAWALILSVVRIHPNMVFLYYGVCGMLAEFSFGGPAALGAFAMWIYVYGWMIYLPTYCIPDDRPASELPWWLHPLILPVAMFGSLVAMAPFAALASLGHHPRIHFPPIKL